MDFKGLGTALVTPFSEDGSLDMYALESLVQHQIKHNTDFLVVLGTTGESVTLNAQEKKQVLSCVYETNNKTLPIVYGLGGNNTKQIIETYNDLSKDMIDGILSVSPYYNKPTQKGIYQHYSYISEYIQHPIILYNVPGRTSSNVSPETTLALAKNINNIVAVKEASGNLEQIMQIVSNKPKDFVVLSGDDALTLPSLSIGAEGVISVVSNAFPDIFGDMVSKAVNNDFETAIDRHYMLIELIGQLFVEGNPAGIKEVLYVLGICKPTVRLPLVNVSSSTKERIRLLIENKILIKK